MRKEIEVMRVVRIPPMGQLVVEVNGQRVQQVDEVHSEPHRRRLLAAIGELIAFAGGYDNLVEEGLAPPLQSMLDEPAILEEETLTAQQAAFLASLEEELKATTHKKVPAGLPAEEIKKEFQPESDVETVNLVAEVDRILQKHITAEPVLASRSIHLHQPPDGQLQIRVDDQVYLHPKEIEDKPVRLAIKKALQEWEGR